jgi:hypothetical protein
LLFGLDQMLIDSRRSSAATTEAGGGSAGRWTERQRDGALCLARAELDALAVVLDGLPPRLVLRAPAGRGQPRNSRLALRRVTVAKPCQGLGMTMRTTTFAGMVALRMTALRMTGLRVAGVLTVGALLGLAAAPVSAASARRARVSRVSRVSIEARPRGPVRVFINGRRFGTTPINNASIRPGRYVMEAVRPDGVRMKRVVRFRAA